MRLVRKSFVAVFALLIGLFSVAPAIGILGSSVSVTPYWVFPPKGITLRWYETFVTRQDYVASTSVSILTAIFVAVVGTAAAVMIALPLVRGDLSRLVRSGVSVLVLIPLLAPAISLGVAIFGIYSDLDVSLNVVTLGMAQLILVLPLIVGLVAVGLGNVSPNVERAAANLGAGPAHVFWRVTLPLLRPALVSAGILALIRSLDDAAVALFLTSPSTVTLPVRMLVGMDNEPGSLVAATGSVLLILGVVAAIILDRTSGIERAFGLNTARRK